SISVDAEVLLAGAGAAVASSPLGREYRLVRRILDGTAAGVAVLDTALRYVYVNPHMARTDGLSAEAYPGRTIAEVLPGIDRPDEVLRQVLRDGRPRELLVTGSTPARSPYVRREWQITYHRLTDEHGEPVGVVGIGLEITEPRQYLYELERAHHRVALLDTATSRIGTTLDIDTTCAELADFTVPGLADAACVDLVAAEPLDRRRRRLPTGTRPRRAACRGPASLAGHLRDLADPAAAEVGDPDSRLRRLLDGGRPWLWQAGTEDQVLGAATSAGRAALCRAAGIHSTLVVPLTTGSGPLGTLSLVRCGPSPAFTREDVTVALELAARAARAIERALHYGREHTMALELQRALLSEPSIPHPDLETASRYLPANDRTLVGGDWFDSFALAGGRNLLVIGDVMGHGVEAAVAMSHYRSMLRALAASDITPAEMLTYADRMVAESGFDRVTTCLLALGDPDTGTVTFANAGHLPPVRLTPQGRVEIIPVPAGPPLGTGLGQYAALTRPGLPGAVLLLYTDGLVERRGEDIDASLARLTRLSLDPRDTLDTLLDGILAQLDIGPAEDDIALLAARPR
ncbi:SpoIIE family protein phosphatase, partial [Streptomyces fulvoviolaceus]|uniref:SpoIIE family protein phosphatase n=1 Tax=Streptomyces fulvoviolaceus TaxID=285535 RepID=UPI0028F745D0